jgi:DNA repair protein RadD
VSTLPLFGREPMVAMPQPKLRPYQKRAIETLRKRYAEGTRRMILVSPTSSGKMFLVAAITRTATLPVLFVAHRMELIEQCVTQLERQGFSHIGVLRGDDDREDPTATIQVASIQTLARRPKPKAGIVFIDEVHRGASDQYRDHIFNHYTDAIIIGLTATPTRLDGRPLGGDLFQTLDVVATYEELIKGGYVMEPLAYGWPPPDLSKIKMAGGDWDETELGAVMNVDTLVGDLVTHWLKLANLHAVTEDGVRKVVQGAYRTTFCFATDIAHSKAIVARFRETERVEIEHLDGTTPERERRAILEALASGELDIVSNCNVLLEGVDIPSAKCAIMARPTQSLVLHRQSTGRILRPFCPDCRGPCGKHPYVEPLLLDHAGNYDRHGPPTEDLAWSLKSRPTKLSTVRFEKRCPECGAYVAGGRATCSACGHVFPPPADKPMTEEQRELVQKDPELAKKAFYDKHVTASRIKGFKVGYASAKFKEKYGVWPPKAWKSATETMFAGDLYWQEALDRHRREKEAVAKETPVVVPETIEPAPETLSDERETFYDWVDRGMPS